VKAREPGFVDADQPRLRAYLPGEGEIAIPEWVAAVKATGYDGCWSPEMYSDVHWEIDLYDLPRECKQRMEQFL
jgi:sugar phosphate isomerase/epimerase